MHKHISHLGAKGCTCFSLPMLWNNCPLLSGPHEPLKSRIGDNTAARIYNQKVRITKTFSDTCMISLAYRHNNVP